MPPLFSSISEVNPSKAQWSLKVRLVRCYQVPVFQKNTFSLECVFHDREGDRIHGSIKKDEVMQRLKPILREGHIFAIKKHDVIGRLVAIDSPQNKEIEGRPRKLIDIVLEDTENNKLPCTLWGDFVDKIIVYVENVGKEPFIVILQMCRAKRFRGEIRVSNVYHITNLVVNGDLDEVTEFRKRLVMEINTPKTISNISSASTNTILEELSKNNIRTIEQISEDNQVGSFWVFAKIVGVESSREWSYLSCKKCPKKVTPVGDKFYCERCDRFDVTGNLKFDQ
ncbi:uncharacterized protein [Primulina eburnea]|uniref:uncharacterized protein n=1 Tax=Primulina eburnea TaxID=1245227 RepID=UPI003C6C5065